MPIYEYRCGQCGHEFETIQKVSEEPLKTCPACHEDTLVKKVSAAGFRLKGGGWYETDFKKGSKRNVAESGGKESGDGGSSSSDSAAKSESSSSGGKSSDSGSSSTSSSTPTSTSKSGGADSG